MHRSTLFSWFSCAFALVTAAPYILGSQAAPLVEQGIGEAAERMMWRRQLAESVSGINWSLVETGSVTSSGAVETTTPLPTTSSTSAITTSSSTTPATATSSVPASAASSTSSPAHGPSLLGSSSTTVKSRSLIIDSSLSPSISSSASTLKSELARTGNIFSPSNRLFAVGVVVIIAIIILAILIVIFAIKRVSHSSRFMDPLDYPEEYHATAISKHYSRTSGPASPNSSIDSYDSLEKEDLVGDMKRSKFGGPRSHLGNAPPNLALPPVPPPSVPSIASTHRVHADSMQKSAAPVRSRAAPPAPLNLPTSSFSTPASSRTAERPHHMQANALPRSGDPRSAGSKASYVSTVPLSPNSKPFAPLPPVPSSRSNPPPPRSAGRTDERLTSLPFSHRPRTQHASSQPALPPLPRAALRRKLVIVGDGACGKTSLLSVFSLGEFPSEYEPTIFENYVAEIRLDGKPVQLALWDTAGQEEYERLRPLSYSKSHVILIAFSLDTPDSLENVSVKWIEEVRELCGPNIPVLLVGCKKDLRDQALQSGRGQGFVTREQGEFMAQRIGARTYKECSALLNDGVDDLFEAATRAAMLVRGSDAADAHHGSGEKSERRKSDARKGKRNKDEDEGGCCTGCVVC
ncbi:uncharacterized protein JCM15063_004810 [Sporobolomyces koalae]|uniref:uncharacterized protein n=1 Tax=Sporobolomyces koalae TaxID=500713 RepID=UPI003171CAE7